MYIYTTIFALIPCCASNSFCYWSNLSCQQTPRVMSFCSNREWRHLARKGEIVFWNSNIRRAPPPLLLQCRHSLTVTKWTSWISHLLFSFCTALVKSLLYGVGSHVSLTLQHKPYCCQLQLWGNENGVESHWLLGSSRSIFINCCFHHHHFIIS